MASLQYLLQPEQRTKTDDFTLVSTWSLGPRNLDFGSLHFRQLRERVKGSSDHLLSRKPSSIGEGLADPSWPPSLVHQALTEKVQSCYLAVCHLARGRGTLIPTALSYDHTGNLGHDYGMEQLD